MARKSNATERAEAALVKARKAHKSSRKAEIRADIHKLVVSIAEDRVKLARLRDQLRDIND